MNNRCKTCKSWTRSHPSYVTPQTLFGSCSCKKFAIEDDDIWKNFTKDMMITETIYGEVGYWWVGEDFGCVHWERCNE